MSHTGMSRSAAVMIAYVMETYEMNWDLAHHYVSSRRHCIALNEGFRHQLKEYDLICKARAKNQRRSDQPEVSYGLKRGLPEGIDGDSGMDDL